MNNQIILILAAAELLALAIGAFWIGMEIRRQQRVTLDRIENITAVAQPGVAMELQAPFVQRVLQPMLRNTLLRIGAISPTRNLDKVRRRLLIAGSPMGLGAIDFLGMRILLAILGSAGFTIALATITHSLVRSLLVGVVAALFCAQMPVMWLGQRIKARQKQIRLALADALDMLTVCVDAGLGLESAFMRIGQGWNHALAHEFRRVVMEIGVGISWREAMRNLVYRTSVEELSALVAVLLQADQLGFSISDTLHAQADQLRVKRRQRAQELARAAPFKMLFPMVFFILPATFAVVLGPAVPAILEAFGGI